MKLTMHRAVLATAGVVVAGGLVLGGTEAFASSPGNAAAVSAIPAAASPSSSAAAKAACKQTKHPRACTARTGRRAGGKFGGRLRNEGVHGQATVKGGNGTFSVQEWQTGKVAAISGDEITVTDASGTSWTWTVASGTHYRVAAGAKSGAKSTTKTKPAQGSLSSVHVGDTVFVLGTQSGKANDATAVTDSGTSGS